MSLHRTLAVRTRKELVVTASRSYIHKELVVVVARRIFPKMGYHTLPDFP